MRIRIREKFRRRLKDNPDLFVYNEVQKMYRMRSENKILIRKPDCKHYAQCLTTHARTGTNFGCEGCQGYEYYRYSMMTADDMPGIALLLRAIFFRKAHEKDKYSR